jgi:dUTP pyrophosphatase
MEIDVNVKLLEDGIIPVYKTNGSAGADCFSRVDAVIKSCETKVIPLGFAVEIPNGYEMQIRPRSGLATKGKQGLFGTIDSDYRGEVCAIIYNNSDEEFVVKKGDRIAQCLIAPVTIAKFNPVLLLSETQRGNGGFGSTGK